MFFSGYFVIVATTELTDANSSHIDCSEMGSSRMVKALLHFKATNFAGVSPRQVDSHEGSHVSKEMTMLSN